MTDQVLDIAKTVEAIVAEVLCLNKDFVSQDMKLIGNMPNMDSLAISTIMAQIEKMFKVKILFEDIDGTAFESVGTLTEFTKGLVSR